MALPQEKPKFDAAAYLAWEADQAERSELRIGVVEPRSSSSWCRSWCRSWSNQGVVRVSPAAGARSRRSTLRLPSATGSDVRDRAPARVRVRVRRSGIWVRGGEGQTLEPRHREA